MYPQIHFHGAAKGVTGSCHELRYADDAATLIDCGLFQGEGDHDQEIDFPLEHIKALVVTHVHIDHVGCIAYLIGGRFLRADLLLPSQCTVIVVDAGRCG